MRIFNSIFYLFATLFKFFEHNNKIVRSLGDTFFFEGFSFSITFLAFILIDFLSLKMFGETSLEMTVCDLKLKINKAMI